MSGEVVMSRVGLDGCMSGCQPDVIYHIPSQKQKKISLRKRKKHTHKIVIKKISTKQKANFPMSFRKS